MYQYPNDNPAKLAWDYTTDIVFGCAVGSIASAYEDIAHRYLFSIPPAMHGVEITCKVITHEQAQTSNLTC